MNKCTVSGLQFVSHRCKQIESYWSDLALTWLLLWFSLVAVICKLISRSDSNFFSLWFHGKFATCQVSHYGLSDYQGSSCVQFYHVMYLNTRPWHHSMRSILPELANGRLKIPNRTKFNHLKKTWFSDLNLYSNHLKRTWFSDLNPFW